MLIVCPSCASEYVLDAARVPAEGRNVRCAACRETFFVAPEAPVAAEARGETPADAISVPATSARDAAPRRRAGAPRPARASLGARLNALPAALWLALAALLGLAGLASARTGVVAALPQTARLYALAGLPVNLAGFTFRDIAASATAGEGGRLTVEGDVVSRRREVAALPPILVELLDGAGEAVYHWQAEPPRATLEPGESARFTATLAAPPAGARQVRVRFALAEAAAEAPAGASQGAPPAHPPAPPAAHGH
jgi:predicted Zn finger-like uncharacterized protein